MNYFFGLKSNFFTSQITVPRFQNRGDANLNYNLYELSIENYLWSIKKLENLEINDDFFLITKDKIDNDKIFFLATEKDLNNFDKSKLTKLNSFTDSIPSYRANLKINLKGGGFSSYQSEYPHNMTLKKGTILSSVSSMANLDAEKNYVIIKNIFTEPIKEKFNIFFVDINNKKILDNVEIQTNYTNLIEINKSLIKPEIFLVTDKYIGIPIFISEKKLHLSFEHTHPPHEYILSDDKFIKITELKREINEIIN